MRGSQLRLKQPTGWFAAGTEVAQALGLLPDGAFKLFMWICLNADRSLGSIRVEPGEVAHVLGKTEAEIQANLRDLFLAEIGQPTADGTIQVSDRFWPYERSPTDRPEETPATYISRMKRVFLDRRCVQSAFTAADEKLAIELYQAGVSIADAEHAIMLGSLRKYVALINNGRGTPITSLRYFAALFEEVQQNVAPSYWAHVERRVQEAERQWGGFEVPAWNRDERRKTK
jgi:hypothetical protein